MKNSGYIIAIVVLSAALLYLYFTKDDVQKRISDALSKKADSTPDTIQEVQVVQPNTENTCTIMDAYGRSLKITGDVNDAQFQRLCQLPYQQQIWFYNWPYYFVGGGGGHHRHHGGHWGGGGHGGHR